MPRKDKVGPRWSPSAVWLYTTSRMTSMPASCSALTMVLNSPTCSPRCPAEEYRLREAGVGAALVLRDVGVAQGQPPDVRLVDDRLVVRRLRRPVVAPVEERV